MLSAIKLNVHVVFFVLFLFSVVSPPLGFDAINIVMVVLTLSAILLLSIKVLLEQRRYIEVYNNYRVEIVLIAIYALVSVISMFNHREVFEGSWFNMVFFGLSPIAIWCSMPLIWLVFKYSDHDSRRYYWQFGWSVFIILALVGIWQAVDFQGAKALTQYFVAADRLTPDDGNVSSLTRISTDFGVIMAFAMICSIVSYIKPPQERFKHVFILMALLFCVAGILSGSRNFLLTTVVGVLVLGHNQFKRNYLLLFGLAMLLMLALVVMSWLNETVAQRFSLIFPFLHKFHTDESIVWRDLLFLFQGDVYTSGRGLIWSRLLEVWPDHFFLGLSHKQFNYELAVLAHPSGIGSITTSAHNIIFQSIVDAGLVGLIIMLTLLYRFYRRCAPGIQTSVFVVVLSCMMVDYYLDHSLPWMLCAVWCLNVYRFSPGAMPDAVAQR